MLLDFNSLGSKKIMVDKQNKNMCVWMFDTKCPHYHVKIETVTS